MKYPQKIMGKMNKYFRCFRFYEPKNVTWQIWQITNEDVINTVQSVNKLLSENTNAAHSEYFAQLNR